MRLRALWLASVIAVVPGLFFGLRAGPEKGRTNYADLAVLLSKEFPEARSLAKPIPASSFIPDPSIRPTTRSWRATTSGRGQRKRLRVQKDHILVQLKPKATAAAIRNLLKKHHLTLRGGTPEIGLLVVEVERKKTAAKAPVVAAMAQDPSALVGQLNQTIRALKKEPLVREAAPNVLLGPTIVPKPSSCKGKDEDGATYFWDWSVGPNSAAANKRDGNYGQKMVRFPAAWNLSDAMKKRKTPNVEVGVLDVGFNQHANLKFTPSRVTPPLIRNHGNHVMGIIGATWNMAAGLNGCTPFANLTACTGAEISSPKGGTPAIFLALSDIIATFTEFIRTTPDLKVVNISLGYNWVANEHENPNTSKRIYDLVRSHGVIVRSLADLAADKGIIIVSAAGNDSNPQGGFKDIQAQYSSPFNWAALNKGISNTPATNIIVVESVGRSGAISPFSNVRGCVSAPGESILSAVARADAFDPNEDTPGLASKPVNNNYAVYDGTSMAAPHVTGLIALMYAYNPSLKMTEVLDILNVRTANRPAKKTPAPLIDAFAALLECRRDSLKDLADLNNDGKVDMADFKLFKQALEEVKKDPMKNVWPRADLNGSGQLSTDAQDKRAVKGQMLSDLEVMMKVWEDPKVPAKDLPKLLDK